MIIITIIPLLIPQINTSHVIIVIMLSYRLSPEINVRLGSLEEMIRYTFHQISCPRIFIILITNTFEILSLTIAAVLTLSKIDIYTI